MDTPTTQLDRVPFIAAFVSDLNASARFYETVLGLPRAEFPLSASMGEAKSFAVQGTTLLLIKSASARLETPSGSPAVAQNVPGLPPGTAYFSFGVADIESYHGRLVAAGVKVVMAPTTEPFGKFAIYSDPDGLQFSVLEVTKGRDVPAAVLSGGGALAAFEVGVLEVIGQREAEAPFILTGTSAGAYNAAFLAMRHRANFSSAVAELGDVWLKRIAGPLYDNGVMRIRGNPEPLLNPSYLLRHPMKPLLALASDSAFLGRQALRRVGNLLSGPASLSRRIAEMVDIADFVSIEPLRKLIGDTISVKELLASDTFLRVATTNWDDGRIRLFYHNLNGPSRIGRDVQLTESNALAAILASAAIPLLFPPAEVGGEKLVDGGVVMNTPLDPAISAGATTIHLICVNPDPRELRQVGITDTLEEVERMFTSIMAANVRADLKTVKFINSVAGVARNPRTGKMYRPVTVHRYHPSVQHIGGISGALDFSSDHIKALIDEGRKNAREHDCERVGCALVSEDIPG